MRAPLFIKLFNTSWLSLAGPTVHIIFVNLGIFMHALDVVEGKRILDITDERYAEWKINAYVAAFGI